MALTKKLSAAFAIVAAAIAVSEQGFAYTSASDAKAFAAEGLVEVNETMTDENGNVAVRLLNKDAATNAAPAEKPVKTATNFAIDDGIAIPAGSGRGRGRGGEMYPFDLLEVGQSFFVPNTDAKPNAAKSLASTVSSATARYAVVDPEGKTKTNKSGEVVPVMVETRKFVVRPVDETAAGRGQGARVWRTA